MQTTATGGKSIYGAHLGIIMLESQFPRIRGDGGNARTWPFPMLYHVVHQATPARVVLDDPTALLPSVLDAARALVALGADGITTNCGFLVLFQEQLANACDVPVASSSLLQGAWVQRLLPAGKRVGVLTISDHTLTKAHLRSAGLPPQTPIVGVEPDSEFYRVILNDELEMDVVAAEADVVAAGKKLLSAHPDLGAIVLECTNMCAYAAALRDALDLPIYDFYSFVSWFHTGLAPRRFR